MPRKHATDWMWSEALDLMAQAERMHRQFFRLATASRAQPAWEPPADVFEDEHEIVVVVAMPSRHPAARASRISRATPGRSGIAPRSSISV